MEGTDLFFDGITFGIVLFCNRSYAEPLCQSAQRSSVGVGGIISIFVLVNFKKLFSFFLSLFFFSFSHAEVY